MTRSALFSWNGPFGLPEFEKFSNDSFVEAFDEALKMDRAEINTIADNDDAPTFDNTIIALEQSGEALGRVSAIFWNLAGTDSDETLRDAEKVIAPELSRHYSKTAANEKLFARIDRLWNEREELGLTREQDRLLERVWKNFRKGGAGLEALSKDRLATINARLAELGSGFAQTILKDESDWYLLIDDASALKALPKSLLGAMQSAARDRGHDGAYAVTLSRSIIEPFLESCPDADLREKAFRAWQGRGEGEGEQDNRARVREIVHLRDEKAKLLDYPDFATFKLEDQMAKTPAAVVELLHTVWNKALETAAVEESDLQELASRHGVNRDIRPSDWRYWSAKLKEERFEIDGAELKPYFALDAMIEAAFDVANRLFGLSFIEHRDVPLNHDDARLFEVLDRDGTRKAMFIGDYFARASKRSGAWMSGFQSQHKLENKDGSVGRIPIIINVMNFAKPSDGEPALLSMDDARTLFHEFGHALHGMMSNVTYPSLAGTSVARDFVELPSQLYEHWLTVPEVLAKHAKHVETGDPLPEELLNKVIAARTFNAGFDAVEFTSSALVDMAFHTAADLPDDVTSFEKDVLEGLKMPKAIAMRHRTPHFAHVFSGDGYSAGYYSYMWSEVLDADAFAAFSEIGDVFNPEKATALAKHIYSSGGSVDPQETYLAFRGRMPTADALLRKRGLVAA